MVHRYVNALMSKITGDDGKAYDKEEAEEKFREAHKDAKDGSLKTDGDGEPEIDSDEFLEVLDDYYMKAKIAGMEEERAKGESSDNLYNLVAMAMLASVINTLMLAAVLYSLFG